MSDERDVQQVLARYVRAADHRDGAAMASLFADDGVVEIYYNNAGAPEKIAELAGAPAIGAAIAGLMNPHPPQDRLIRALQAALVGIFRDAIAKVNDSDHGDAVTAARRAIDTLVGEWPPEKDLAQTPREERMLAERLAMLRHSLPALASPSARNDDNAESIQWDRGKPLR